MILYIGTKKYSSWSLRPWSFLVEAGIEFQEVCIPFEAIGGSREFTDGFKRAAGEVHPSERVPVLHDNGIVVWESLAICDYLSREYRADRFWPRDRRMRAFAQSFSTEIQSEFADIRNALPFWCTKRMPRPVALSGKALLDWQRLVNSAERALSLSGGPFLFGEYSIADAMILPMMARAETYLGVKESPILDYMGFVLARPAYTRWVAEARQESVVLPELEIFSMSLLK